MVAALWLTDLAQQVWLRFPIRRSQSPGMGFCDILPELVGLPAMVGLVCWQAGYFTLESGVAPSGFGDFRMNLIAP